MNGMFPKMYDRPEAAPVGIGLTYWFAFVVGLPSIMVLFLRETVPEQAYSGTSWIMMAYCAVNFAAVLVIFRGYLSDSFLNVRLELRRFFLTVTVAVAALLLVLFVLFLVGALSGWTALKEDIIYMLPFAEMPMLFPSMAILETHPILGTVCMVVLAPVFMSCLYYATVFSPLCCNRPWLAYIVVVLLSAVPRIVGLGSAGMPQHQLILFLLQLPWHMICCWAYQKADTIWAPICVYALCNLVGCVIWPLLVLFLL